MMLLILDWMVFAAIPEERAPPTDAKASLPRPCGAVDARGRDRK